MLVVLGLGERDELFLGLAYFLLDLLDLLFLEGREGAFGVGGLVGGDFDLVDLVVIVDYVVDVVEDVFDLDVFGVVLEQVVLVVLEVQLGFEDFVGVDIVILFGRNDLVPISEGVAQVLLLVLTVLLHHLLLHGLTDERVGLFDPGGQEQAGVVPLEGLALQLVF